MDHKRELQKLRAEIDSLDAQLTELFARRMDVCEDVARVKAVGGLPVTDAARERQALDAAVARARPDDRDGVAALMGTLFTQSKIRQRRILPLANIIFIGLPGCGKTVISKETARALGMPWHDSDLEIEMSEGMGVPEIFGEKGEEYFRQAETRCLERLTAADGAVIAAGGGAVLKNAALITRNAVVVYIKRSIGSILTTLEPGTRPLLKDPYKLYELHEQRRGIYESLADITVENNSDLDGAVGETLEKLRGYNRGENS